MQKLKKKYAAFIFLLIILNIALNINVNAQNYQNNQNNHNYNVHNPFPERDTGNNNIDLFGKIFDIADAGKVTDNLPETAQNVLDDEQNESKSELTLENISEKFSFGFIFNIIMSLAGSLASAAVKNFIPIIALIIISAAVSAIKDLNKSESFTEILNFVMVVCLAGAVFYNVRECFYLTKNFLDDIHAYMMGMMPVMTSLSTLSGNIASAAVHSAGLFTLLNVVEAISGGVILPALQICYALSLARCLTESSGGINLSGICTYVHSVLKWIFVFVMTFLGAIILFQNILSAATDSVAMRTVKFTVSSFVPVVGGVIGDATTTIMGSIQAVKSVTGVFGVLVIIITLLPPLISVILHKLLLNISGAFALILNLDKQAGFLKEMNTLLDMTLAVMAAVSVVFIFDITLFIKTAAAV